MEIQKKIRNPFSSKWCLWEKSSLTSIPNWLYFSATIALFVYASCLMITDSVGTIAQRIIVTFGFIVWVFYVKPLRKSPVTWLLVAAILIPLISWGGAHLSHPQWAEASPKVHRLTSWFMFIPVSIWLGGREKNVLILWVVALCGLLAAPWISGGGWGEISRGFSGYRVDFDLHNAQHAGMLFAVALLGVIAFSKRFIFKQDCISWIGVGLWSLLVIFCSSGVLITQTRGVWLGLVFALMTMSLVTLTLLERHRSKFFTFKKVIFSILLVSVGLSILTYTSTTDIIKKRLSRESDYILKIVGLNDEENIAVTSSVGSRVTTWIEGIEWVKERPIIGWGGNGRRIVIQNSVLLPQKMKGFGHFHNSYLDVLVMFGLLGVVLYLSLLLYFVSKAWFSYLNGHFSFDFLVFFVAFLIFWFVVNLFESYMFFSSGTFVFSLILGGFMTFFYRKKEFPL